MENKKTGKGRKIALIIIALLAAAAVIIYLCTALAGSKPAKPTESPAPTESAAPASPEVSAKPQSGAKPEASAKPEVGKDAAEQDSSKQDAPAAPTQTVGNQGGSTSNQTAPGQTGSTGNQNTGVQTGSTGTQTGGTQPGGHHSGDHHEEPEHQHGWQPVYKTVHHDEAGHYDTVVVQAAWDEPEMRGTYVCNACGYQGLDAPEHISWDHDGAGSYGYIQVPTGNTIHHDAVTEQRWVVDIPAYDEQVVIGYKCSCGQEKIA